MAVERPYDDERRGRTGVSEALPPSYAAHASFHACSALLLVPCLLAREPCPHRCVRYALCKPPLSGAWLTRGAHDARRCRPRAGASHGGDALVRRDAEHAGPCAHRHAAGPPAPCKAAPCHQRRWPAGARICGAKRSASGGRRRRRARRAVRRRRSARLHKNRCVAEARASMQPRALTGRLAA